MEGISWKLNLPTAYEIATSLFTWVFPLSAVYEDFWKRVK
jgi:hypothetical protein